MTQTTARATVSGPITGGKMGWPFASTLLDISKYGYVEAEYNLEGTATSYKLAPGAELTRDGHWQAVPSGQWPFRTRMLIYRPADPAKFNGTAVVVWNNVTAGYDLFGAESLEIFEGGYAYVCLTTQKVGIEGLPPVHQGLANWDPERYGSLSIPSDDYSYDVFTQGALAVGPNRSREGVDPMGGLEVRRVIGQGASQSAGRIATYVNAIQPLTRAFDGFILSIYFGSGTPLEVGDVVVNINAAPNARPRGLRGTNLLRDDLGVPIFVVNSELEAIACYDVRQPDTDTFRYWESAGTCHQSIQVSRERRAKHERDQLKLAPLAEGINAIPMSPLYDAAFHHMHRWLVDGTPPPVQPKAEFAGTPPEVVRDEHGIAKGGIRLPQVEAPLAQNSSIPLKEDIYAYLGGSCHPFTREKVHALYGDKATFLAKFRSAADRAVAAGVLLPRDVELLVSEASETWSA
ncbi:MAG: alpha/beta hydrolase domain-containing protein [Dehalococcoidia bacterium]